MSVQVSNLVKSFGQPPTIVLHGLSFDIESGDFVAISGKSGSGKTTLLYILSTLDLPTSGFVKIDGQDPSQMTQTQLHEFRNRSIGFIFQFHYLLPELTTLENVLLPTRKHNLHLQNEKRAKDLLEQVGLSNKLNRLPSQLSGGEQQRVAIARALIMRPKYIFADEPTGNLDSANGIIVMDMLKKISHEDKTTIVLVTHEPDYAAMAKRQIFLADGRIVK